jgi:predicted DCC family thiol-disulfide oxidoreductase YuxK
MVFPLPRLSPSSLSLRGLAKLSGEVPGDVWFVYDGQCPICSVAAHALQIKKSVGNLHLVNAREDKDHPLLKEVNERQLDLDDGMVLKYRDGYYHGEDALHMMALLGSGQGWFNRMNASLFRSKLFARLFYPAMRAIRNMLLRLKGVPKIRNLKVDS